MPGNRLIVCGGRQLGQPPRFTAHTGGGLHVTPTKNAASEKYAKSKLAGPVKTFAISGAFEEMVNLLLQATER